GASGSGKSSLVAAGLLPSLLAGLLPGSERWATISMRPGEHPVDQLARALSVTGRVPSLLMAARSCHSDDRLVVFVDQFEEIFTSCADDDERASFVEELVETATTLPDRTLIVVAIRGDFYERCASYPTLS